MIGTEKVEGEYYKHNCRKGHVWYSKNENPKHCGIQSCQSPYWNKPYTKTGYTNNNKTK